MTSHDLIALSAVAEPWGWLLGGWLKGVVAGGIVGAMIVEV